MSRTLVTCLRRRRSKPSIYEYVGRLQRRLVGNLFQIYKARNKVVVGITIEVSENFVANRG